MQSGAHNRPSNASRQADAGRHGQSDGALSRADVMHLTAFALTLQGRWKTKVSWTGISREKAWWLILFQSGPVADVRPAIAIERVGDGYVVTVFDFLSWLDGEEPTGTSFDDLSSAISAILDLACELMEMEGSTGRTWDCLVAGVARTPSSNIGLFQCEVGNGNSILCEGCSFKPFSEQPLNRS